MHERVTYLLFIIHAFQSLEQEAVRVQVLKLVSLPLWHALSRGRLQVSLASRAACCPACRWLSGLHSSKATLPWQKLAWSSDVLNCLCTKPLCVNLCAAGAADT